MPIADPIFETPQIRTQRLILRPFEDSDIEFVKVLLDDKAVAATTLNIPHPYTMEDAKTWINSHKDKFSSRLAIILAITKRSDMSLIGAIELRININHNHARIGYWIGQPFWNHGFCTEAVKSLVKYSFETLNFNKVYASVSTINPASKRVLEKAKMVHEGHRKQHIRKWGAFYDTDEFGITRDLYMDLTKQGDY